MFRHNWPVNCLFSVARPSLFGSETVPRTGNEEMTVIMAPKQSEKRPGGSFWNLHREAALNWLALGMLLAAWNAAESEPASNLSQRPKALRGYVAVSVRAARQGIVIEL